MILAAAHRDLVYAGAGHLVGTFPCSPRGIAGIHPVSGQSMEMGGTRQAVETARRDAWPKLLDMLAARPAP